MKKTIYLYFLITLCTLFFSAPLSADAEKLPYMKGWINSDTRVTVLDTVSGNRGTWAERDYRTAEGVPFHAVWVDGAGSKGWDIKNTGISEDDGPLGTGATYKTLIVAGENAVIEHHPVIGYSLSVKAGTLGTLTLESKIATEKETIEAGETLIKKILQKNF